MKMKYGIIICTVGNTNKYLREIGIAQSMQTVMLDDRLGKRFDKKEMVMSGGKLDVTELTRLPLKIQQA